MLESLLPGIRDLSLQPVDRLGLQNDLFSLVSLTDTHIHTKQTVRRGHRHSKCLHLFLPRLRVHMCDGRRTVNRKASDVHLNPTVQCFHRLCSAFLEQPKCTHSFYFCKLKFTVDAVMVLSQPCKNISEDVCQQYPKQHGAFKVYYDAPAEALFWVGSF